MRQLPFVLLLSGSLLGCVASSATDSPSDPGSVTSALSQPNGGYDTADEAPMFGASADFDASAIEADAAVTDPMAQDSSVTTLASSPTAAGRDVIVMWGHLPIDRNAQPRDWSGQLQLSRGAMIVRRTVGFEQATDKLLPRSAADTVAFQSITKPFVDGLALRVLDPDPSAGDLSLVYTSTPPAGSAIPSVTYTLDLSQLDAGPIVVDAGNGDKLIAIGQHEHDTDGCAGGFMRGRWHALAPSVGVYLGIVTNRLGEPVGHVRGIYGVRKDGAKVMFGKFIDRQGKFLGILAGTYGNGDFLARWKTPGDDDHGRIRGMYVESSAADAGAFAARWAQTQCSEDPDPTAAP